MTEALLVIDVQNDFCPGGALAVPEGDHVVEQINRMVPKYDVRVFSQDWHPADHSSFASQHTGKDPFATAQMPYGTQVLWPDHCVQGTPGAAFHPALTTDPADMILRKGFRRQIDSYSGFFENDRTTATGLEGYLRSRHVTGVVVVGLAFDFCVAYTALDAARLGFSVRVVQSACRAIDLDGSRDVAAKDMRASGIELVD